MMIRSIVILVAQAAFLLPERVAPFVPKPLQHKRPVGLHIHKPEGLSRYSDHRRLSKCFNVNGNGEYELLVEREDEDEEQQVESPQAEIEAIEEEEEELSEAEQEQFLIDESHMRLAIEYAKSRSEEAGAYPNPVVGAALVTSDGQVLGLGCSSYKKDAIQDALQQTGLDAMPLREWCVTWPSDSAACWKLRDDLADATLYVTLEPLSSRRGEMLPPMTQLIELSGVARVVIGTPDPVPERSGKGSQTLHRQNGLDVTMGAVLEEECQELVEPYMERANSKLQTMARTHRKRTGRPMGLLHCSVVDSDDIEAFAQLGNAFGKSFGGQTLSFRDFGSYEMAPPPEQIWAEDATENPFVGMDMDDDDDEIDAFFEDKTSSNKSINSGNVIMPYYSQVDAVIGTFPRDGNNGPMPENNTIKSRLNGLKWLSTFGTELPKGVERILVLDATDLENLPLSNSDPNLPRGVDIEKFWSGEGRKPTRVLLRRGRSTQAEGAARAAAEAAKAAAKAALATKEAIETGEAESAAEAAMEYQSAALAATEMIQKELSRTLAIKQKLQSFGVVVETLNGKDPLDVMKHLGKRNGYGSVVWRAGCWGQRGVQSILDGAFQSVSAHLAVDANGGPFWQQMLAERAVQGACGPESRVKVFCSDEDVSLEFCDSLDADGDCVLTKDGKPVRHVRLDCRVALVDKDRPREFVISPTKRIDQKVIEEEAPWFL